MSHGAVMPTEAGPSTLAWSEKAKAEVAEALERYPVKRSAVLPVLWIAQREWGWLPTAALRLVAESVGLPESEVFGIATFYTMFNMKPVGRHHLQVVPADGPQVEHRVERGDAEHLGLGQPHALGHEPQGRRRQPAPLPLRDPQHGHHGGALHRVARQRVGDFGLRLLGPRQGRGTLDGHHGAVAHRSISPSTMSMLPIAAITSAISLPSTITGSACRFTNEGERIFMRQGRDEPSLTR